MSFLVMVTMTLTCPPASLWEKHRNTDNKLSPTPPWKLLRRYPNTRDIAAEQWKQTQQEENKWTPLQHQDMDGTEMQPTMGLQTGKRLGGRWEGLNSPSTKTRLWSDAVNAAKESDTDEAFKQWEWLYGIRIAFTPRWSQIRTPQIKNKNF